MSIDEKKLRNILIRCYSVVMNNAILLVSILLLFAIFGQAGGVTKCYKCENNCTNIDDLEEEICTTNANFSQHYLCWAWSGMYNRFEMKVFPNQSRLVTVRKCIINEKSEIDSCNSYNQKPYFSCYTCDTDLCNKYIEVEEVLKKSEINRGYVRDCFFCDGQCENPLRNETCDEFFDPYVSEYLCMAAVGVTDDATIHKRKCMPNNEQSRRACKRLNWEDNWSCYTCDKNLCNGEAPVIKEKKKDTPAPDTPVPVTPAPDTPTPEVPAEQGVQKCYFCEEDECEENPKKIFSCGSVATDYVCSASVYERNGIEEHLRRCLPNTRDEKFACDEQNLRDDESCYSCHKDLCNREANRYSPDSGEDSDSVTKCHACTGRCEEPREQICEINNYLCQEKKNTIDDKIVYERKCVQNTEETKEACRRYNQVPGDSCYYCNTDLCNNMYALEEQLISSAENYSVPALLLATLIFSLFLIDLLFVNCE